MMPVSNHDFWTIWITVMVPVVVLSFIAAVWLFYLLCQVQADIRKYDGKG